MAAMVLKREYLVFSVASFENIALKRPNLHNLAREKNWNFAQFTVADIIKMLSRFFFSVVCESFWRINFLMEWNFFEKVVELKLSDRKYDENKKITTARKENCFLYFDFKVDTKNVDFTDESLCSYSLQLCWPSGNGIRTFFRILNLYGINKRVHFKLDLSWNYESFDWNFLGIDYFAGKVCTQMNWKHFSMQIAIDKLCESILNIIEKWIWVISLVDCKFLSFITFVAYGLRFVSIRLCAHVWVAKCDRETTEFGD